MAHIAGDGDKEPRRRGPKGGYGFDFFTFCLLAIAVLWAAYEIAIRHL